MSDNIFQNATGEFGFCFNTAHGAGWHGKGQGIDRQEGETAALFVARMFLTGLIPHSAVIGPLVAAFNGCIREFPEMQQIWWADESGNVTEPAAIVGSKYTPMFPQEMRDRLVALAETFGGEPSTAGRIGRRGQILFASIKLGSFRTSFDGSRFDVFANLSTTVDGTMRTVLSFSVIRVVCQNTLFACIEDGILVRHTANHDRRLDAETERFAGINGIEGWKAQAELLARKKISRDLATRIVRDLYPGDSKNRQNLRDRVMDGFGGSAIGSDGTDSFTAWQLLQALTEKDQHEGARVEDFRVAKHAGDKSAAAAELMLEHMVSGASAEFASKVTSMLLSA